MNEVLETGRYGRRSGLFRPAMAGLVVLAAALLLAAAPVAAQQEEGTMQDDAMQDDAMQTEGTLQDDGPAQPAAAEQQAAPAAQPAACEGEDFRRFDFWLGEWEVHLWGKERNPNPPINRISKILDGCALREEYDNSQQAYAGTSLNFFDPISKNWHQTWIDNGGQPLYLEGGWQDGKMVLSDDPQDERPKSRITWTPQPDGTVRQTWELSRDGGETWKTLFDGHYVRRGGS